MHFKDYLKTTTKEINKQLDQIISSWNNQTILVSPRLKSLYRAFTNSISCGKVIRGTLVKLGYELTGSPPTPEILKPAAAFEILHTSLLTHDDIIDQSSLRRGKPTLYKALGGNHYGISQSICLGDLGFFLATQLIAESNFKEESRNHALSVFSGIVIKTIEGEMLDVELARRNFAQEEKDVLTVHRLKTAYYSIVGPLSVGAILGGATQRLLNNIKLFGESLGIAFQIQDDILGVFGDPHVLGKSVTSDIEEGKNTLLITYARKNASASQKNILGKYYGKGEITKREHALIKKVFKDAGALVYSQEKSQSYSREAQKVIPRLTDDARMKVLLNDLVEFLINRQR